MGKAAAIVGLLIGFGIVLVTSAPQVTEVVSKLKGP